MHLIQLFMLYTIPLKVVVCHLSNGKHLMYVGTKVMTKKLHDTGILRQERDSTSGGFLFSKNATNLQYGY